MKLTSWHQRHFNKSYTQHENTFSQARRASYALKRKWAKFLTLNKKLRTNKFDMSVAYNVLPESWGGCLDGGGGAGGSVRRLLPLVA